MIAWQAESDAGAAAARASRTLANVVALTAADFAERRAITATALVSRALKKYMRERAVKDAARASALVARWSRDIVASVVPATAVLAAAAAAGKASADARMLAAEAEVVVEAAVRAFEELVKKATAAQSNAVNVAHKAAKKAMSVAMEAVFVHGNGKWD
jgi:hypothetical protein